MNLWSSSLNCLSSTIQSGLPHTFFNTWTLSPQPLDDPHVTKGSVTVAKAVELTNSFEHIGCRIVHRIANNHNETASDGTTTATVIACGLYEKDIKSIGCDINSMDTKICINICCKYALNILTKLFGQELMDVKVLYILQPAVIKQLQH